MMYEQGLARSLPKNGAAQCYQFDDRLVCATSDEPDDLRAIIGALLIEADALANKRQRRQWWQLWR